MDKLYAPWRDCYVQDHVKKAKPCDEKHCVFCDVFAQKVSDKQAFVLYRNDKLAIMLNLYPYNGGHVLVFPKQHSSEFFELSEDVLQELMVTVSKSMKILKQVLRSDAINFGANVGKYAGAGIPEHVHMHIVPRWGGDTGFMPVIAQTKQVSVDLSKMYKQLKPAFDKEFLG